MRELEHCYHSQLYSASRCTAHQQNFLECHNRSKQVPPPARRSSS